MTRRLRLRLPALLLLLAFSAVAALPWLLAGCENAQAREATATTEALDKAATEFGKIMAGPAPIGSDAAVDRKMQLEALTREITGIRDRAGHQDTARALLLAAVHQQAAAISLAEAVVLETQIGQQRRLVGTQAAEAAWLGATSGGFACHQVWK